MKEIQLSQGLKAQVDDEDYDRLNAHKWCAQKTRNTFRASRQGPEGKAILMHREITKAPFGMQVDHVNGDALNNQKSNLRLATSLENCRGFRRKRVGMTSQFRGVSLFKPTSQWRALIHVNKKCTHLGLFDSELDAARAYDVAASQYFGAFAHLNFPAKVA